MATNTAGSVARELSVQAVHFLRKNINESSDATGEIGVIPAGSIILAPISGVDIKTVFTGTNPDLQIGITGSVSKYGSDLDLDAAVGFVAMSVAIGHRVEVDTTLIYTLDTDTPAGNEDGEADIIIAYIPNI